MIEDMHRTFIDTYLQTDSIEEAAVKAGVPKHKALSEGIDLMNNPEIQEALKKRAKEFETAYDVLRMTKERFVVIMMSQYEKANRFGKTKEAVDILAKIAEASGIDFKGLKIDPVNFVINNLDENKI